MRHTVLAILVSGLLLPIASQGATQSSPNYTNNAGRIVSGGGNATDTSGLSISGDAIGQGVFIPQGGTSSPDYIARAADLASAAASPLVSTLPNGDINGDGRVDIADALLALRSTVGLAQLSSAEMTRGDVGPLVNSVPVGDGKINIEDAILILRKAIGLGW